MMIKRDEFSTLVDYYKGKISESTLLDKAARVAAEAQILIDDPNTPAALKEPVVKEMLKENKNNLWTNVLLVPLDMDGDEYCITYRISIE